jgi:hypothetical protein
MSDNNINHQSNNSGYEKSDLRVNKVVIYGVIAVIVFVAIIVFLMDYFVTTREEIVYETVLKPESAALRDLRAREGEILNSYQVLDSVNDVYRIPIERAMKLIAEEDYRDRQKAVGNRSDAGENQTVRKNQ